jgi:hypothetical protein
MSVIALGSSMRVVGGGVGDQAEGVVAQGVGAGAVVCGTAASIAARREERKFFRRGHNSSVAMWSFPGRPFSRHRKHEGGQSQCWPRCLAPRTLQ